MTDGTKHDSDKLRLDLIPILPLRGVGDVLTFGARKYADRNWEKGLAWSRVYGAALRHLTSFWNGENSDTETGLPHIDHALCCLLFLSEYVHRQQFHGNDDRPYTARTNGEGEI